MGQLYSSPGSGVERKETNPNYQTYGRAVEVDRVVDYNEVYQPSDYDEMYDTPSWSMRIRKSIRPEVWKALNNHYTVQCSLSSGQNEVKRTAPLLVDCLHCHISSWSFWKCSLFDIVSRRIRSSTDYLQWRVEFILVDRSWPGDAATKSYGKYESHMVSMVQRSTRLSRILGPISYCIWYDIRAPLVLRSKRTSSMTSSLVASLALSTQFVVLETTMGSYRSKFS